MLSAWLQEDIKKNDYFTAWVHYKERMTNSNPSEDLIAEMQLLRDIFTGTFEFAEYSIKIGEFQTLQARNEAYKKISAEHRTYSVALFSGAARYFYQQCEIDRLFKEIRAKVDSDSNYSDMRANIYFMPY